MRIQSIHSNGCKNSCMAADLSYTCKSCSAVATHSMQCTASPIRGTWPGMLVTDLIPARAMQGMQTAAWQNQIPDACMTSGMEQGG